MDASFSGSAYDNLTHSSDNMVGGGYYATDSQNLDDSQPFKESGTSKLLFLYTSFSII